MEMDGIPSEASLLRKLDKALEVGVGHAIEPSGHVHARPGICDLEAIGAESAQTLEQCMPAVIELDDGPAQISLELPAVEQNREGCLLGHRSAEIVQALHRAQVLADPGGTNHEPEAHRREQRLRATSITRPEKSSERSAASGRPRYWNSLS